MQVKYFELDTGHIDMMALFQQMIEMATKWNELGIRRMEIVFVGLTKAYVVAQAEHWYNKDDEVGEDYLPDIQDRLVESGAQVKELKSRPQRTKEWIGDWNRFMRSQNLFTYASTRIKQLQSMADLAS